MKIVRKYLVSYSIFLVFMLTLTFKSTAEDKNEIHALIKKIPDKWKLTEYKQKGSKQVWFFRKNLGVSELKSKKLLPILVYFTVTYKTNAPHGLPTWRDVVKLDNFEETIIPKVEKIANCILVGTVMKNGIKDHLFYVSDAKFFLKTISKYKNHLEGFSVAINKQKDPKWKIYATFP